MNLISFMSFLILGITIMTMVFGVIAYFLYKARERKQHRTRKSYEDVLKEHDTKYLFFNEES